MSNRVGLVLDDRYLHHAIPQASPENPTRLRNLIHVVRSKYADKCSIFPAREASIDEIARVHSHFYLEQLKDHVQNKDPFSYDKDTYLMEHSFHTAQLAAGGCLGLAEKIMCGSIDCGFAMIRPPGHHAEPGRGMGFCVLNNVAITAQFLRSQYDLNRILIIDFDAHHGNGTQEVFYDTDEVLVISLHQQDLFPFTGKAAEIGTGQGAGYNVNIPVFSGFGDTEYTFLLGRLLQAIVEQYLPQIILVSAGYDGHCEENISGTNLSTKWYGLATDMLKQYALEVCGGRLLMILEGGYNAVALEASILQTIDSLLAHRTRKIGILHNNRAGNVLKDHPLHQHWTLQ